MTDFITLLDLIVAHAYKTGSIISTRVGPDDKTITFTSLILTEGIEEVKHWEITLQEVRDSLRASPDSRAPLLQVCFGDAASMAMFFRSINQQYGDTWQPPTPKHKWSWRTFGYISMGIALGLCGTLVWHGAARAGRWVASIDWSVCPSPPDAGVDNYTKLLNDANKLANATYHWHKEHRCEPEDWDLANKYRTPDCNMDVVQVTQQQLDDTFKEGMYAGHLDYSETLDCYTFDCPATKLGCVPVYIDENGDRITQSKVVSRHLSGEEITEAVKAAKRLGREGRK